MTLKSRSFLLVVSLTLLFVLGCNKSQPTPQEAPIQPKPATIVVDASTAGTITGVVSFVGMPQVMSPIDMSADPGCPPRLQPSEVVELFRGKLANVFIYVKEGLPQGAFAVPSDPVVLDQKGCRYYPHVMGIMAGQPLKVLNSDTADHNIHDMPNNNPPWNESQMPTDKPILKTFAKPEMMIPVQCNQHPWMRAYINVMQHPYFAVSAADGSYEIKNLPPGEYTLAAVHEKFGEQVIAKLKVGAKQTVKAPFIFSKGAL